MKVMTFPFLLSSYGKGELVSPAELASQAFVGLSLTSSLNPLTPKGVELYEGLAQTSLHSLVPGTAPSWNINSGHQLYRLSQRVDSESSSDLWASKGRNIKQMIIVNCDNVLSGAMKESFCLCA